MEELTKSLHLENMNKLSTVLIVCVLCALSACDEVKENLVYEVQSWYKYRDDGKPGREVKLIFSDYQLEGSVDVLIRCNGKREKKVLEFNDPVEEMSILLPEGSGVDEDCTAEVWVWNMGMEWSGTVEVPKKRQWKILIYPHSHVDIGYTNTHANVELIHKRNLINGLKLAKKTIDYPEGARYLWNPEVIWPVDRYLNEASDEERNILIQGIRDGYLHLDAGYVNLNTSLAGDEEMLEFFRLAKEYEDFTGRKIETIVQVDIPGMSWGIVPVAAQLGIKYVFTFNNGYDRVGNSIDHSFRPFWWSDPSGKHKILFLQPGSYTPGALVKGKYFWPSMAGQTDPDKLIEIVKTDNPRENFIDDYLNQKLPELEQSDYYPYDIFAMSWAMADNTPIDADLPEAVKSWNEEFAFPRLRIVSATEIMRIFDERYGDELPVLKGDFTEYWTDGSGTAAKQTAMNRSSKERLVQAETLWTMLRKGELAPRNRFNEAWRNIIMGSEHTWCYMQPDKQPISSEILDVKFKYFQDAEDQSLDLLSEVLSGVESKESLSLAVFNTLSWNRSGLVKVPAKQVKGFIGVVDENDDPVKSQLLSTGEIVFKADDVPAFGSKKYVLSGNVVHTDKRLADDNILDNGLVRVEISPETGDIVSLKLGDKEFVDQTAECAINSYRYLLGADDPEAAFKPEKIRISIKENGPLIATITVHAEGKGINSILSEISVVEGSEEVQIRNVVDKIATKKKEGVHFGFAFNIDDPKLIVDIPWGYMEVEKDQLEGANRNWITLQRWLDVSNDEYGITWCPIDAPMFEVGTMTANILGGASRSEKWIKKLESSATIYSWALNNHWHTNFQLSQGGELTFRYHIMPHRNQYSYGDANHYAMEQAQPLVSVPVQNNFKTGKLLSLEGSEYVSASVFKTLEDGKTAILRLRSHSTEDEMMILRWHSVKPASVSILDLQNNQVVKEIEDEVVVPARGFVSLKVVW